jgi:excisionase family DNA binding protein
MSTHQNTSPRLLRLKQAATYSSSSVWTLRRAIHDGDLRYVQIRPGGPFLIDICDLDTFIDKHKQLADL